MNTDMSIGETILECEIARLNAENAKLKAELGIENKMELQAPSRKSKLYNWLANTFGITKEYVETLVRARVDHLLEKKIRNYFEQGEFSDTIIKKCMAKLTSNDAGFDNFYERKTWDKLIECCVANYMQNKLKEEYDLKLIKKVQ